MAEDVSDFVRAARLVLANPEKYRLAYTADVLAERSWERQAEVLLSVYNQIADASPIARKHLPFVVAEPKPIAEENSDK